MAWKIVGVIESRGGDLEVLPEWCIGTPNHFDNLNHATTVRDSMQSIVDAQRSPRVAGHAEAPKSPPIKYMLVPCIDKSLIDQLHGKPVPQEPAPTLLKFGTGQS